MPAGGGQFDPFVSPLVLGTSGDCWLLFSLKGSIVGDSRPFGGYVLVVFWGRFLSKSKLWKKRERMRWRDGWRGCLVGLFLGCLVVGLFVCFRCFSLCF